MVIILRFVPANANIFFLSSLRSFLYILVTCLAFVMSIVDQQRNTESNFRRGDCKDFDLCILLARSAYRFHNRAGGMSNSCTCISCKRQCTFSGVWGASNYIIHTSNTGGGGQRISWKPWCLASFFRWTSQGSLKFRGPSHPLHPTLKCALFGSPFAINYHHEYMCRAFSYNLCLIYNCGGLFISKFCVFFYQTTPNLYY